MLRENITTIRERKKTIGKSVYWCAREWGDEMWVNWNNSNKIKHNRGEKMVNKTAKRAATSDLFFFTHAFLSRALKAIRSCACWSCLCVCVCLLLFVLFSSFFALSSLLFGSFLCSVVVLSPYAKSVTWKCFGFSLHSDCHSGAVVVHFYSLRFLSLYRVHVRRFRWFVCICMSCFFFFLLSLQYLFLRIFHWELDNRNQHNARCNRLGTGNRYITHNHAIHSQCSSRITLQYCTYTSSWVQSSIMYAVRKL